MAIVAKMGVVPGMARIAIGYFREADGNSLGDPSKLHTHQLTLPAFRQNKNVAKRDSDGGE